VITERNFNGLIYEWVTLVAGKESRTVGIAENGAQASLWWPLASGWCCRLGSVGGYPESHLGYVSLKCWAELRVLLQWSKLY